MDPFVARHLQGVSRTYAILVPMLPDRLADAVGLAYLVMRIVDTLEDDPRLSVEQRLHYFALLEAALDSDGGAAARLAGPLGDTRPEQQLMQQTPEVLLKLAALDPGYREPICAAARSMMAGIRRLIARSRQRDLPYPAIRDSGELREYCYYVAGVVGEMLCAVMAHFLSSPALNRLRDLAVELGVGLQLVNILKDAARDRQRGRRYLPLTDDGQSTHAQVYQAALAQARQSLQRGIDFVLALPPTARELRSFCGLPIAWGAMTLTRAQRGPGAAQAPASHISPGTQQAAACQTKVAEPKITRRALQAAIRRFDRLVTDDQALRRWLLRLLRSDAECGVPATPQ